MTASASIGRFVLGRRLGAGGFATVWLAHDPELDAPVAVKVLADNWAGHEDVRRRFIEEARLLRRVDSDHVVRVYDIGSTEAGQPYFVMTYADQGCLHERLAAAPPPWPTEQVLAMVDSLAAGLEVLHRHGIVHRDVKPRNILLRSRSGAAGGEVSSESVLLGDLGVAKDLTWASGLTQPVGTAGYHAPEQGGYSQSVSAASDVYALAVVAGQLLGWSGPPWPAGPAFAVLTAATEPDPDRRIGSAAGFAAQFRTALQQPEVDQPTVLVDHPTVLVDPPTVLIDPVGTPAPASPGAAPGRRAGASASRRRRRLLPAAVVVALTAAAVAGWLATHQDQRFTSGRLTQQLSAGWTATGGAAVPGETAVEGLTATGPGGRKVEAALTRTDSTPATVAGRTRHPECKDASAADISVGSMQGSAFRWTGCRGGSTVDEVGLADPGRAGEVVWLRVVSIDGDPGLEQTLAGLSVRPSS